MALQFGNHWHLDGAPTAFCFEEILRGARAIADFLGCSEKAVYHLIERGRIPHYRIGRTICARRSHLLQQADQNLQIPLPAA
jgi:excisionase family DNA binding protein